MSESRLEILRSSLETKGHQAARNVYVRATLGRWVTPRQLKVLAGEPSSRIKRATTAGHALAQLRYIDHTRQTGFAVISTGLEEIFGEGLEQTEPEELIETVTQAGLTFLSHARQTRLPAFNPYLERLEKEPYPEDAATILEGAALREHLEDELRHGRSSADAAFKGLGRALSFELHAEQVDLRARLDIPVSDPFRRSSGEA